MTTFIAVSPTEQPFVVVAICRHEDSAPYPSGMTWREIDPLNPPELGSQWDGAQWVSPSMLLGLARNKKIEQIDDTEDILRAFVLVLLDELNLHSSTIAAMLAATTNATSLNDLKTRMGQISAIPQRTTQQLRTAIRNKLGT